jgi:glycosyltransferase involved in cell wall biosynthesis
MSTLAWVLVFSLAACLVTLAMTILNLRRFRPAPDGPAPLGTAPPGPADAPLVSVCIPARNEEANIEACVRSLLGGDWPNLEVLVYDDQSTDATPRILSALAREDARVRVVPTVPLPAGWNGKQHACDRMGRAAAGRWLLFTDADVRFEPFGVRRAVLAADGPAPRGAPDVPLGLVSTFPRQITGSLGEALLVPMIFFILMSYLPIGRMRRTLDPGASAGCGQFLLVGRDAYLAAGGHAALRDSMHDGIKLPRAVRRAGFRTDLFDGTDLCSVRMYRGFAATWRGFAKNAYEGLGSIALLLFLTVFHVLGHVLPWAALVGVLVIAMSPVETCPVGFDQWAPRVLAPACVGLASLQRWLLARRFRQPLVCIPLHPVGVLAMTLVQWHSLLLHITGRRSWRGRTAGAAPTLAAPLPEAAAPSAHP